MFAAGSRIDSIAPPASGYFDRIKANGGSCRAISILMPSVGRTNLPHRNNSLQARGQSRFRQIVDEIGSRKKSLQRLNVTFAGERRKGFTTR